jgi:predicted TPR repeat methyltransferase
LDIGAGTGFVGEYLKKHGYTNVDALEPSKGMLEVAGPKNIYKNMYQEEIAKDKQTSRPDGLVFFGFF